MRRSFLIVCVAAFAGCGPVTSEFINEEFDWLTGRNGMGDPNREFSRRIQVIGPLNFGERSSPVQYHNPPSYRAFTIAAQPGDPIDVWVRSSDGNASAWLFDASFHTVAKNDDADMTTKDSHITATVPPGQPVSWYIVFREHSGADATFNVMLAAKPAPNYFACATDADCVAIPTPGCCPDGSKVAVNVQMTAAYQQAKQCMQPNPICPQHMINETRIAECNFATKACEMVQPEAVQCGGNMPVHHDCQQGWHCVPPGGPGMCQKDCDVSTIQNCNRFQHADADKCACVDNAKCAGIAGLRCPPETPVCIDDPRDMCRPGPGPGPRGADCIGVCVKQCVQTMMCIRGSRFDHNLCRCVPMGPPIWIQPGRFDFMKPTTIVPSNPGTPTTTQPPPTTTQPPPATVHPPVNTIKPGTIRKPGLGQ
jgi:hypothetical protein